MTDNPSSKNEVALALNVVSNTLDKLLATLNSAAPGQSGLDEALNQLMEADRRLTEGSAGTNKETPVLLEDLKRATTRLGESIKV